MDDQLWKVHLNIFLLTISVKFVKKINYLWKMLILWCNISTKRENESRCTGQIRSQTASRRWPAAALSRAKIYVKSHWCKLGRIPTYDKSSYKATPFHTQSFTITVPSVLIYLRRIFLLCPIFWRSLLVIGVIHSCKTTRSSPSWITSLLCL